MKAASRYDAIVIGAGVNGLTCAALLGKAGMRVLLVERRGEPGGCAAEHELAPGFRVPTLAHRTGPLRADVVESLRLAEFGLGFVAQPLRCTALSPDGRALPLWSRPDRAAEAIRPWSTRDAEAWPAFVRSVSRLAGVIGTLFTRTPPDIDRPDRPDLWTLMRAIGAFRGLSRDDQWRLLRWGPMPVADLLSEVFDTELLRAAVAADGLLGAMLGPWSAGSGLQLLFHETNLALGALAGADVDGGPAAAARALERAARRHGVEIRTSAPVSRVLVAHERVSGIALASGDTLEARAVVSSLDPRLTFTTLCEPEHLPAEFLWRIRRLRARGVLAKLNLALSALPAVPGATREMLAGPVRIAPSLDYLERAFDHVKYGGVSRDPWIEFTVPSLANPSLAPAGAHVLSAYVQWVPHDDLGAVDRRALLDTALATLERCAPGLRALIVAADVITPADLDREWGLTGGHIFHGELSLDQAFTMRPLLGCSRYATPLPGLYLCGSGTHPGTGLTGGSGANAARVIIEALR